MRDAAVRGSGSTTQENQIKLKDQRVILTGAAGGMGSILANLIADAGAEVALIDANAEALQALAEPVKSIKADLKTMGDISKTFASRIRSGKPVHRVSKRLPRHIVHS